MSDDILDLVDDAQETFPAKEDLKDRLVAIWVTGKHGKRKGAGPDAKPYDWYETVTLVLDDGPNWDGFKIVDGEKQEMLVPSVAENGPQRLDGFQYSQSGLTQRLSGRVHLSATPARVNGDPVIDKPKSFKPYFGRINSRKNKQAGYNASWSISVPTDADQEIKIANAELIRSISAEMEKAGSIVDSATDDDGDFAG
jgi:hypothetical protein